MIGRLVTHMGWKVQMDFGLVARIYEIVNPPLDTSNARKPALQQTAHLLHLPKCSSSGQKLLQTILLIIVSTIVAVFTMRYFLVVYPVRLRAHRLETPSALFITILIR